MRGITNALVWLVLLFRLAFAPAANAETVRIGQFNVENYLAEPAGTRPAKSEAGRAKVRESLLALHPDVLALEEIGGTNALLELQGALRTAGLDLPHWEMVTGFDTNIHVAVLSKFAITARRPHTNDAFLLGGRRFQVSRGFAEVDIRVSPSFSFTLLAAHLKSKRAIAAADEAELRVEEARILRGLIDARLAANLETNLVVIGDLNDTHDSPAIRAVLGPRGKKALVDTRPAERNGDIPPPRDHRANARQVTWTHFYAKEDTYSRIDYILISHGMNRYWQPAETYIPTLPNWGLASDHRPLVAAFSNGEP